MTKVFIIAGNYAQYRVWIRINRLSTERYPFVSRPEQLRGQRGSAFAYVGSAAESPLYGHVFLRTQDMKEISETQAIAKTSAPC